MTEPLYDTDFDAWAQQQAAALRVQDWSGLDRVHLAEEVEGLRKTECRGVRSQLRLIVSHVLKWVYQPEGRLDPNNKDDRIIAAMVEILRNRPRSPVLAKTVSSLVTECEA